MKVLVLIDIIIPEYINFSSIFTSERIRTKTLPLTNMSSTSESMVLDILVTEILPKVMTDEEMDAKSEGTSSDTTFDDWPHLEPDLRPRDVRTGLVDLDVVHPCTSDNPCLLDKMIFEELLRKPRKELLCLKTDFSDNMKTDVSENMKTEFSDNSETEFSDNMKMEFFDHSKLEFTDHPKMEFTDFSKMEFSNYLKMDLEMDVEGRNF